MKTTYHMGVSVRGVLSWPRADFRRFARGCTDDGKPMTVDAVREALFDHLAQGHEIIPIGDPCDGWSWTTGCPGHPVDDEAEAVL